MKSGKASQTAVLVCMARAIAHERTPGVTFRDPVALALLPDEARARVERYRADQPPRALRARLRHAFTDARAKMMAVRTLAIDDAIRAAAAPQLVILGAGLDGRAWRMQDLHDAVVFEVDHPNSQREKRARTGRLQTLAREVRFVPVDFATQDLDQALRSAGHDPSQVTTWVWEGVVMYLARPAIEATLAVVARRSPPGSRLCVLYFSPALMLGLVAPLLRRLGEPVRSVFTREQMRALLERHGFALVSDEGLDALGAARSPDLGQATRRMKHLRIATAERRA